MKNMTIYADGAAKNNGKENALGGYGTVLIDYENKRKKELNGAMKNVTNNIMELTAIIVGLKFLKSPHNIEIYTDSQYVVNGFNKNWIYNWKNNGWRTASGTPVKNKELWEELYNLTKFHNCKFNWIKGHNDNEWNERCDELANIAINKFKNNYSM